MLDWRFGFSRGQRHTPNRVDWEFRSGANAFPNTYDVSDPAHPIITPTAELLRRGRLPVPARAVPQRHGARGRADGGSQPASRRDVRRPAGLLASTGLKVTGRDKTQDRENQNYNVANPVFTLADFGLARTASRQLLRGPVPFRADAEPRRR